MKRFFTPTKFKFLIFSITIILVLLFGFLSAICKKCPVGVNSWKCGCNPFFGLESWPSFLLLGIFFSFLTSLIIAHVWESNISLRKKLFKVFIFGGVAIIFMFINHALTVDNLISPPIFISGSVVTERGIVLENTVDGFAAGDGPYFFRVRKETGIRSGDVFRVLYHPQSDDRSCINAFIDGLTVKAGEKIEVRAVAINENTLSICPSKNYYIKLLSQSSANQGTKNECEIGKEYLPNNCVCPDGTTAKYLEYSDNHTGVVCEIPK